MKDTDEYKKVYINKDLTVAQLDQEKKLREDRNERNSRLDKKGAKFNFGEIEINGVTTKYYWGIRNGELRKIKFL